MRDELIGNFRDGLLHGGVISATFDVVGGMAAMATAVLRGASIEESLQRLRPTSTIDLRVDYLRPGAVGGSPPAVSRCEPALASPLPEWSCTTNATSCWR